jgi:hypothetical protein
MRRRSGARGADGGIEDPARHPELLGASDSELLGAHESALLDASGSEP